MFFKNALLFFILIVKIIKVMNSVIQILAWGIELLTSIETLPDYISFLYTGQLH